MDDIKLYQLCKVINPIAMRGEPVQNFVDIRGAIEDLGQFTPAEIDGMESEWKSYMRMCQRLDVQENDGHWKSQMDRAVLQCTIGILEKQMAGANWHFTASQLQHLLLLQSVCFRC